MGLFNKNKEFEEAEYTEAEPAEGMEQEEEGASVPDVPDASEEERETQEERREARRKRRRNNEILVSLASVMSLVLVVCLVYAGVYTVKDFLGGEKLEQESTASESTENIQDILDSILASETELPTEVVEVVTAEELLDEYLDTVIAGMTLEEKVAGLFVVTPEQLTGVGTAVRAGDGTKTAMEEMPIGGLVYYRKNMESAEQIKEMLTNTVSYSKHPMFLAVNEGGDSTSSVQNSPIEVPDVTAPGSIKEASEAYQLGQSIGAYLAELNFNVNFAPTADILYEEKAAVAGQCFGGDASFNSELVAEFVKGLEEQGVSAAVKTFPGTGHLTASTTSTTVSTDKSREDYAADLSVFQAGIDAGADFVMVSNIVAPELSGGMEPCSMSAGVVTDILRGELGFDGIIITEPMNGKAITEYYSASEAAVAALKAGCDMILMPENLKEAYQGILDGVANGSVAEARINDSLKRVFRVKYADKLEEFADQ